MKSLKVQQGGSHYKQHNVQPIKFIHGNNLSFIEGNIIKYVCRWRNKGGKDDLLKVKHYIDLLIDLENL